MHAAILAGVRGRERQPGELRSTQNWIGPAGATIEAATFVPPPPTELGELLTDLERFVHEEPLLPPLVQAALVHYQFETIHPFLDGNGRLGRLLIVFFLVVRDRLPEPLLYLSPYFEARRQQYYDALQGVRERGEFDNWLGLSLDGVGTQAADAVARAERLTDLREHYRSRVRSATRGPANRLVDLSFEQPVLNARFVELASISPARPHSTPFDNSRTSECSSRLTEAPAGSRAGGHTRCCPCSPRSNRGTHSSWHTCGRLRQGGRLRSPNEFCLVGVAAFGAGGALDILLVHGDDIETVIGIAGGELEPQP